MRSKRNTPAAAFATLLAITAACAVNPATGEREISLVSESQEIEMGRGFDQQVVQQMGLVEDEALQRYVNDIGQRMAAQSERPNLPWTFRVIDDPVVNAFAAPGGFIYITRGILAYMDNEAQLAAVLGHEIGHVTARHTAQQITRTQLAQGGLILGSILSDQIASVADVAAQGLGLLFLKYGRDDERQSDDLAFRYMQRTDYDVRHIPDVFNMLARVSAAEGAGRIPEWLSTHPDPGNRAAAASQRIASLPPDSIGTRVARNEFLTRIDGLVFGEDPREGYFRADQFVHPELRFQLVFPSGWQKVNQKQAVIGINEQQNAMIQLTLAQGNSAQAAATTFLGQQGLQSTAPRSQTINGLRAVSAEFAATTEQGVLRGLAVFIEHGSNVYQLLGYSTEQAWSAHANVMERSLGSFAPVNDPALLNVEPTRIDIVQLSQPTTLAQLANTASVERLALLNQVSTDRRFEAGTRVKRLVGGS